MKMSDTIMYHQLGAQDAQFIYSQSPSNLTHVMAVSVYDPATAPAGKVQLSDIAEHVRSRLHASPVFTRKLFRPPLHLDHPYWVEDPHFDLEAHFTHSRLPEPGDWKQFTLHLSRHFSRPMDMHRPLWDFHIIEGIDNVDDFAPGSYAVITRVHHAAIDGIGLTHLFGALSDSDAKGTPLIEISEASSATVTLPPTGHVVRTALRNALGFPLKFTRSLAKATPELLRNSLERRRSGEEDKPLIPPTRFNGSVSPHKLFDAMCFELEDFKRIKSAVEGATINDAVLAVVGGALRSYLQKHKELPEGSLIGWCPVNIKPGAGEQRSSANNLSGMQVAIGTDIANPMERLVSIRTQTRASKSAESGAGARLLTDLTQHIPSATMVGLAQLLSVEGFAPKFCNLFVSNVPGSPVPLYMNGARCTHQYGLAPLGPGMGLFLAVGSYDGRMIFNIISDRNILPDIAFFRACVEKSFKALLRAASKRR